MKPLIFTLLASFVFLAGPAFGFETALVALQPATTGPVAAGTVEYSFQLFDSQSKSVGDVDLAVDEEKKLHMIVYDPSLREFQHVHPIFDGQVWKVQMQFAINGEYWVWAQGVLVNGHAAFTSSARLSVTGGQIAWPMPPVLGDVRMGSAGNSVVQLSREKIVAGQMTMLDVQFTRNDGTQPDMTPYLGAFAHLVAVSSDGASLQHVHPMSTQPNEGMIHAMFMKAGEYRLWIQFIDGGVLKVIPLSLSVEEK